MDRMKSRELAPSLVLVADTDRTLKENRSNSANVGQLRALISDRTNPCSIVVLVGPGMISVPTGRICKVHSRSFGQQRNCSDTVLAWA